MEKLENYWKLLTKIIKLEYTQKINHYRDQKKNKFCIDNNLSLHRFWEYDIINNTEEIKCDLKKLFQLSL